MLTPGSFGGQATRLWGYKSTHTVSVVAGSSFFSDGYSRGMRVGDFVHVVEVTTAGAFTGFAIGCVSTQTTGSGVSLTYTASSS
jgi:hypothetical protein